MNRLFFSIFSVIALLSLSLSLFAQTPHTLEDKTWYSELDQSGNRVVVIPQNSGGSNSGGGGSGGGSYVPPQSSDGFTQISPSADSRVIYVSSSEGNDANSGLTSASPKATVLAGLALMRTGFPDHLLLKRGDTWRAIDGDYYWWDRLGNGRSESEPAVIGYYGASGARPRLEKSTGAFHRGDKTLVENFHIIGLEFAAYKHELDNPAFTGVHADKASLDFVGGSLNLLIEDCLFSHVELKVQPWDIDNNGSSEFSTNIKIRRNIFTGAYTNTSSTSRNYRPSNMYIEGTQGLLIEENVIDMGGWHPTVSGAGANQLNHNIYLQYGQNGNATIVRNNIITRGSSHGIQARAGGLVEDNFFARNSIGLTLGYHQSVLASGTIARAQNNVVSEGWSMARVANSCLASAYVCTGALWGIQYDNQGGGNSSSFIVSDNIVSGLNDDMTWTSMYSSLTIGAYFSITSIQPQLTNNITFNWAFNNSPANPNNYPDPGRTLADYNESLGGTNDFEEYMDHVLGRPLGVWYPQHDAKSINSYIRAGYGL